MKILSTRIFGEFTYFDAADSDMPPVRKKRKVAANFLWQEHDSNIWKKVKRRSAYNSFRRNDYSSLLNARKIHFEKK